MRAKVTIAGAGMTGGTMAQRLAETGYIDVVLQDIIEGMPQGKALDLAESAPHAGFNATITGSNDWKNTKGSDVVVITSGVPRKPGMTREELLNINAGIVRDVATAAIKESPDAVFIIFANPMDAMCHVTLEATGLPPSRVIGQAGLLDSARYPTVLAWASGASATRGPTATRPTPWDHTAPRSRPSAREKPGVFGSATSRPMVSRARPMAAA